MLAAFSFFLFMAGPDLANNVDLAGSGFLTQPELVFEKLPILMARGFGLVFLCLVACIAGKSRWVAWVLLAVIYLPQVVIPFARGGHAFRADLFVFGMVVHKWPFQGNAGVVRAIREYWLLLLAFAMLISIPHVTGRCDLHPLNTYSERLRFYVIECMLIIVLVSGAMATSDSQGVTRWLSMWALYAYCFHVAWARLLPVPYGALLTYASIPVFYVLHSCWSARKARLRVGKDEGTGMQKMTVGASTAAMETAMEAGGIQIASKQAGDALMLQNKQASIQGA